MSALKTFSVTASLLTVWAFSTWVNSYQEFSKPDSISFSLYFIAILLVMFSAYAIIFYAVRKKSPLSFLPRALNALICVFGFHTLVLVHIESVAGLSAVWTVLLLSALLLIFFMLFRFIDETKKNSQLIYILIGFFFAQSLLILMWDEYGRYQVVAKAAIPARFSYPEFERRPNVYLIGFDALIPASIGKKLLGIDELKYVPFLERNGFRAIRNSFADRVPTASFYNSLAAMDKDLYDNTQRPERHMFDTGEMPAPLHALFRKNGYKIQFIYKSSYFGIRERAKLDFYGFQRARGICTHVDDVYGLLGYCLPAFAKIRGRFSEPEQEYPAYLFDRIKETAKSGEPWLTIAHIWYPGHTGLSHSVFKPEDMQKYKTAYKERAEKVVAQMQQLIDAVRENDPDAVLFIFGDHGTFSSRGLTEGLVPEGSPMTEKEVFQDRRANAMFVSPKDFCLDGFKEPFGSMRLGRNIVKCLSGGKDPLPADYQSNDDEYLPYLYE